MPETILDMKEGGTLMARANAKALPRFCLTQHLRSMRRSLSHGYTLSITTGKYDSLSTGHVMATVNTVFETRRARLKILVGKHGSVADLNRALGWEPTNARLYQIHNRSIRADRGTAYEMGDPTAREIEQALQLPVGWMDTPPTYAELLGEQDPRVMAMAVFESLPPEEWPTALRLLGALAQPPKKNGTEN